MIFSPFFCLLVGLFSAIRVFLTSFFTNATGTTVCLERSEGGALAGFENIP